MTVNLKKDNLEVLIYHTRTEMGASAAESVAHKISELLTQKEHLNIIFAAAPSQTDLLATLVQLPIAWERINAFHMDEYVGLNNNAPQGFGNFLRKHLFDKVKFKQVNFLNGNAADLVEECKKYEALLTKIEVDIVCMGIGENTHIAFNDPHVAKFNDTKLVKVVDLDEACRQQQVNDGCFHAIEEVPSHAITLTVPALLRGKYIFCVVPCQAKAKAVYHTLNQQIKEQFPSTSLRKHLNAMLFLDKDSSSLISQY
jgi:glucosamine-6-phosphate deaminase